MEEHLQIRVHCGGRDAAASAAARSLPTLIYLPGLHGDWTLIGGFRKALVGRVHFVEMNYPRTLTWSLDDYAANIEKGLAQREVREGWLLGESYGSQVAWQLVTRNRFQARGVILAGGFIRHPVLWGVRLASGLMRRVSPPLLPRLLCVYAQIFRVRFRGSPEVLADMKEFLARRTDLDCRAAKHRLDLISANDPCEIARGCSVPVYSVTGALDAIVPWPPVRSWLKRHCAAIREQRIVWHSDHTVLATAPKAAARQVLKWVDGTAGASASRAGTRGS